MNNSFKLEFEIELDGMTKCIPIQADAEFFPSEEYFLIKGFRVSGHNNSSDIIPAVTIKRLAVEEGNTWVHIDSDKESHLSKAIGSAIEKAKCMQ